MRKISPAALALSGVIGFVFVVQAQAPKGSPAGRGAEETYRPPRTPWGDPDLQGKWPSGHMTGVPLQRPESFGTRNVLTDAEFAEREAQTARQAVQDVADFDFDNPSIPFGQIGGGQSPPQHWLERGEPQRQASLIVDPPNGRMPALTAAAQKREAQRRADRVSRGPLDSYTDLSLYERCITRGVAGSILPGGYNNGNQIVQSPGYVTIVNEMIHESRIVPLDASTFREPQGRPEQGRGTPGSGPPRVESSGDGRPRLSPAIRQYMGDSRGRWDGDTLVVETTNFTDRPGVGMNDIVPSEALKITERFNRTSDTTISYSITIDDPMTWTAPFTIQYQLKRDDGYGMFEYACHEGNYALQNILSGARAGERAAAETPQRSQP
jgi:hypothetical protein